MKTSKGLREPGRQLVRFTCRGHEAIRASHRKTLELTRERDISARATCMVGVAADYDPRELARLRGRVWVHLSVAGVEETLIAEAAAFPDTSRCLILRRHPLEQTRTFARGADKASSDLDRRLVAALARSGAVVEVTIEEVGTGSPGALAIAPCEAETGSPGLCAALLAADGIAGHDQKLARDWSQGLSPRPAFARMGREADVQGLLARLAAGERWVLAVHPGDLAAGRPHQELVAAAVAQGVQVVAVGPVPAWQRALWISGFAAEPLVWLGPAPRAEELVAALERQADRRAALVSSLEAREISRLPDLLAARLPGRRFATSFEAHGRRDQEAYVVFAPVDASASAELPETVELDALLAAGVPLKPLAEALAPRYGASVRRAYQALLSSMRAREEKDG